ncbi:Zn-ribbon domain-containing OB-fold protein [Brevibacterium daeguense]|uniref:Zn-ribbon domain-containing OB-fold protein n=1 Tax=Brevibacterium daeguense TaxID=909936 RepID=A0ABP8EFG8_9MICO|nr:zinc ribbon domain-containing protein [Brevibacterium daeguense]
MIDSQELEQTLGAGFGALFHPYFDGLARGQLAIPRCTACGRHQFPPRSVCVHCRGHDFAWDVADDPRGTLFTWTVVHHAKGTEFEALAPYAVALISLAQFDVRLYGLIPEPEGLEVGASVRLVFPSPDGEVPAGSSTVGRPHWVHANPD